MSSSSLQPLVLAAPSANPQAGARRWPGPAGPDPDRGRWPWPVWIVVIAAVIAGAVVFVAKTGMRPSYDPYGWLVWGHQTLRWDLNLNAAPSWKPLTFVFTLPYALFHGFAVPLWSVTATAGTIAMGVFAARITYRLADAGEGRWAVTAAWIGALFAGVGVLGMEGLPKLTFIANSDQLNTALVLAAIDAHLSRRPRLAYVVLFFAALGRPEVWPFAFLYGIWLIWKVPGARVLAVLGWVLIGACWFVPTAVAAKSIFQAGNLDLGKATAIHGNKIVGVFHRWAGLYEWPMQVAALLGVAIGVVRRDRRIIGLTAAALLWVIVEIAFALHGWSAVPRYVMESAAVMITLAGVAVAELLAGLPGVLGRAHRRPWSGLTAVLGTVVVVGILVALAPFIHRRAYQWKAGVPEARAAGVVIHRLSQAVAEAGGPQAILACGHEVAAKNQYQSQLAWAMGLNVSAVYFNPPLLLRAHRRMVLFTQRGTGWVVRPYNVPASQAARCAHVAMTN